MKTTLQVLLLMLFLAFVAAPTLAQEDRPSPDATIVVDKEAEALNINEVGRTMRYPNECKKQRVKGKVFVRVLVGRDGKIVKHIVKRTPHDAMTKEVERVLYDLRFSPAELNGKPVESWVTIPFAFRR